MTATETCPDCGGLGAFTLTDITGARAVVCPRCIDADQPNPPTYETIRVALAAEGELDPMPAGHEDRMRAVTMAEIASMRAVAGYRPDPLPEVEFSPETKLNKATGWALALLVVALFWAAVLKYAGVL